MTTKLLLTRAKEHLFSTRPPRALSLFRKRLSLFFFFFFFFFFRLLERSV
jgi:hypothetical protein